jgi:hypothetical protein
MRCPNYTLVVYEIRGRKHDPKLLETKEFPSQKEAEREFMKRVEELAPDLTQNQRQLILNKGVFMNTEKELWIRKPIAGF